VRENSNAFHYFPKNSNAFAIFMHFSILHYYTATLCSVNITGFFRNSDFREINFWTLEVLKIAIFAHFKGSEFPYFGTFQLSNSAKIQSPKLISRKI